MKGSKGNAVALIFFISVAMSAAITIFAVAGHILVGIGHGYAPSWMKAMIAPGTWLLDAIQYSDGPIGFILIAFVFNVLVWTVALTAVIATVGLPLLSVWRFIFNRHENPSSDQLAEIRRSIEADFNAGRFEAVLTQLSKIEEMDDLTDNEQIIKRISMKRCA